MSAEWQTVTINRDEHYVNGHWPDQFPERGANEDERIRAIAKWWVEECHDGWVFGALSGYKLKSYDYDYFDGENYCGDNKCGERLYQITFTMKKKEPQ